MQKDIIKILLEKENRCKNLQTQARAVVELDEKCSYLQQAADLEYEMSTQTTGAEKDHHIREKNRLDYEIMKIREELDSSYGRSSSSKGGKPIKNENYTGDNGNGKKSGEELELDRVARTWYKDAPVHSFKDVSGMYDLKKKLESCIEDAKAQDLMEYLHIPKLNSYFFVGPPGCGKTYIIEAFAHELMDKEYKYISIQGSDIISRYVGVAEKNVTRLFEEAEKNSPCIVFIDEVDSLCKNRSLPNLPEYAANITTQFLTGYNRIHSADSRTIFIAATNYPNRVDAAMLDRAEIVRVPLPDKAAREAAFRKHFEGIIQLQNGFTFEEMAEKTNHYNYRDIERLAAGIKKTLFHELMELFKVSSLAVETLSSGKYKLSRSKFNSILEKFKPSPKETILRDLRKWEKDIKSVTDTDDVDVDTLYESNDTVSVSEAVQEIPEDEQKKSNKPENPSGEPVYTVNDEFIVDPQSEMAEITFYLEKNAADVVACINGDNYATEFADEKYSFHYKPEQEEEAEVFVSSRDGYIGNFTARFAKPIVVNKDFDI